ncbi:hypothetical protein PHMEG_00029563 [Phytophthora megakarya]|uniref:Reverse transcriptase domain-containing protein n=1 Tax=Phytophthora megakarya TaxID=4795 RepID=A0A225V2G3_9STRA|nr:hypothetical protein PHMEG_00029563 [Phytophthora megakarya]
MLILEVVFDRLRGSSRHFSLDFFKGFLIFGMVVLCYEIYSILTEEGVITPTRVLMNGHNSVAYVQTTDQEMFAEIFNNGLLIWIDDLLGYDNTCMGLLELLKKVLGNCAKKGLKLNPKRMVSGEGVSHDPKTIEALTNLPLTQSDLDFLMETGIGMELRIR